MNKAEEIQGRFEAVTANMCDIKTDADVIINTSCEHIKQEEYDQWLAGISNDRLLILQSNNYLIPEHIRSAESLCEFKTQCGNLNILWSGDLELPLYTRFMVIARPS
jgi:hypothetical protein